MDRLERYRNSKNKIWLNVASSEYVMEDFANIDNHAYLWMMKIYPFGKWLLPARHQKGIENYRAANKRATLIRHDCRRQLTLPDSSVDHIVCSHFLEHVYPAEAESILSGFFRILMPNGTLHVIVPDLKEQAERYLRNAREGSVNAADEFLKETLLSREDRGTFLYRLLEFAGGFGLQHRWMYDRQSISARLVKVGFSILGSNETPSKHHRFDDGSVHVVACKGPAVPKGCAP